MADGIIFVDGFDRYASVSAMTENLWFGPGGGFGTGRSGSGQSLIPNTTSMSRLFGKTCTKVIAGIAVKPQNSGNFSLLGFGDGSNGLQVSVIWQNNAYLEVRSGNGTLFCTSSSPCSQNVWCYVELMATIATGSGGSVALYVNGVSAASAASINTAPTGNAYVSFFNTSAYSYLDDLYVVDNSSSTYASPFGDCAVQQVLATGAGTYTEWTPSTGSNYTNINGATPGANNNSASVSGKRDTYAFTLPNRTIKAVQAVYRTQKSDAGPRTIYRRYVSGSNYDGSAFNPSYGSYSYYNEVFMTDPSTSSAWAASKAMEFGQVVT